MISFFSINNTAFASSNAILSKKNGYTITSNSDISKIIDGNNATYNEFEKNGKVTIKFDQPIYVDKISISTRQVEGFGGEVLVNFYDEDNNELGKKVIVTTSQSIKNIDVNINEIKEIVITGSSYSKFRIYEFEVYGEFPIYYYPVSSLSAKTTHESVELSWINPKSIYFKGVDVYEGERFVENIKNPKDKAVISALKSNTSYTFKVFAVYADGGKSIEKTIDIQTEKEPEKIKDVENVKVNSTHERIDLSWSLPSSSELKHVNIYRDEIKQTSAISNFIFGSTAYAASTKIFETNGTYFNDLTVKPQTTYEYTLTTTDGIQESEGVTVQATTPKAPLENVGGVESEEQENGDYIFKWTSPTKGEVQIYVGGKKYKKVPASDGKILIPKADLKFNAFGDPDVTLQAIDEDGEEGAIISPGGSLEVPFTPGDVVKSGNSLFALIAPFVLLGLSLLLVPKIIKLIRQSNNGSAVKSERTGRAEKIREPRPSRETREYRRGRTT